MRIKRKRLCTIILIGIALVVVGFAYQFFWRSLPVGQGPTYPPVTHESFSAIWTDKQVLLVGLGDSVTAGFGARKGYSYFDRLITNPSDEFLDMAGICLTKVIPTLVFTNLAMSGSTSIEHLKMELPRLPQSNSNTFGIVVITTGGNDLIHNYGRTPPKEGAMYGASLAYATPWIGNFEQRLESMIQQIKSRFPGGCLIFLANIYDPTDGIGDSERAGLPSWKDGMKILQAYNDIIRRCTEKNSQVHLVDIHSAFLGHGIHCTQFWREHYDSHDPHYWFHENLEDPNEPGYDAIRRLFLNEIAKVRTQMK